MTSRDSLPGPSSRLRLWTLRYAPLYGGRASTYNQGKPGLNTWAWQEVPRYNATRLVISAKIRAKIQDECQDTRYVCQDTMLQGWQDKIQSKLKHTLACIERKRHAKRKNSRDVSR